MNLTPAADERLFHINEGLSLLQAKHALAFGTDAYLLYAFMRPAPRGIALELGCGNGAISLLAAKRGLFSKIYAVEIQERMADLATRNAALNELSEQLTVLPCDLRALTPAALGGEVEVVFAVILGKNTHRCVF